MFNFTNLYGGATKLFHSTDFSELMSDEDRVEANQVLAEAGLAQQDFESLSPDGLTRLLTEDIGEAGVAGGQAPSK